MSSRGPAELPEELADAAESSPVEDELSSSGPVELAGPVVETGLVEPVKPELFASTPPHAKNSARNADRAFRDTPQP